MGEMPRHPPLSPSDPVPLYYQLELQLRRAVIGGAFGRTGRLPTEIALARTYGVSRMTVRAALERLEEDGLIVRRRGRGTYVNADSNAPHVSRDPSSLDYEGDLRRAGVQARVEVTGCEAGAGPPDVLEALGLGPDAAVWRVRRRGFDGATPLWIETRYYPVKFKELLTPSILAETVAVNGLLIRLGFPITGERWRLAAGRPTPQQARRLSLDASSPVLQGEYTSWSGETAIQWGQVTFRGDRYRMTFAFGVTGGARR